MRQIGIPLLQYFLRTGEHFDLFICCRMVQDRYDLRFEEMAALYSQKSSSLHDNVTLLQYGALSC